MAVEFVKDIINYEDFIGEGQSQTMVNGDIVISEREADVSKVLYADSDVYILNSQVVEDKVIVEGKVNFRIYYASNDLRSIFKAESVSNFTHNLQIPGVGNEDSAYVEAQVEHLDYQILTNKKIKANAVVNIKGYATRKQSAETIVDIKGQDIQMLRENLDFDEYLKEVKDGIIVKSEIDSLEEIEDIVKTDVFVYKKELQIVDDKVLLNAVAKVRILALGKDEKYLVLEQDVPFSHEIEVEDLKPNMKLDLSCKVKDVYIDVIENDQGERKKVLLEANIDVYIKVYSKRQIQSIQDAYSSDTRYEFEKSNLRCFAYFNEVYESQVLKEKIIIDDENIKDVKYVSIKPYITEVKVFEDKVSCEGVLRYALVYLNKEDALEGFEDELPFKFSLDIEGARIDMISKCYVDIETLDYEKFSDKEVDLKVGIVCHVKLYKKDNLEILKSIFEVDISDIIKNMPSLVIYTVQPHDTLWKIAKKYGTKIEDIIKLNDIENPDYIEPGMKLIIPKKTFMK